MSGWQNGGQQDQIAQLPSKGALCFTFDDGYSSWIDDILPSLHRNQRVSFMLTSNKIDDTISSDEVKTLFDAGNEIGNHSKTHVDLTGLTPAQRVVEYEDARTAIEAIIGAGKCNTFTFPFGAYDAIILTELYLRFDRSIKTGGISHYPTNSDGNFITGRTSWLQSTQDTILELIRLASVQPIIVVVYAHDPGNSSGSFATDPTVVQMKEAFDLCYELGVPMLNSSESIAPPFSLINGGFENGLDGWVVTNSGGNTVDVVTDTPDDGLPGTKSAHVDTANATYTSIHQTIQIPSGANYIQLSYRHHGTHAHAMRQYDVYGAQVASAQSGDKTNAGWIKDARTVLVEQDAVEIRVEFLLQSASEFWLDHVHVGPATLGELG